MAENPEQSIYETQPGDTLESIATKFNISLLDLKLMNGLQTTCIIPGIVLKINMGNRIDLPLAPIDSQIFDSANPIEGKLLLNDNSIVFEPYNSKVKPTIIDMVGYLASTVVPHPCEIAFDDEILPEDSLVLLTINYNPNIQNQLIWNSIVFTGKKIEITHYQQVLIARAKRVQEKLNYVPPPMSSLLITKKKKSAFKFVEDVMLTGVSNILNQSEMQKIRKGFPSRFQTNRWHLLYSIENDGSSFTAFEQKCRSADVCLLVITTSYGDKIGAFVPYGFKENRNYYSSGEAFVFTFTPVYSSYKFARTVPYFVSASSEELSIGGKGAAAIWIDGHFCNGFSETCLPFNSPSLTTKTQFTIVQMEIWEIGGRH